MFRLIQILEKNDKLLSDYKNMHSNVPWRAIKGMQNIIVYDYGVVDIAIVYDTVKNSIPKYYEILTNIK